MRPVRCSDRRGGGVYLPGGVVLPGGCVPAGGGVSQHALRQKPPVDIMTDACENITLPHR